MKSPNTRQRAMLATILLSSFSFIGCSKNDVAADLIAPADSVPQMQTNLTAAALAATGTQQTVAGSTATTTTVTTKTVSTVAPLFNLGVNWTGRANSTYNLAQATPDFKNVQYWDGTNTSVFSGMMTITLKKNVVGPAGGNVSHVIVPNGTEYQLNYNMMFDSHFDFSWGGKTGFGLFLGEGNTGGDPAWDGNGGSLRLMWYKNTSTSPVILKPYVYYKDQPGVYGDDFGKAFPATGSIGTGKWYQVRMYVKSNTGSNKDGWVRVTINGVTLLDQAIRWTTNDMQRFVNGVGFETFRGGSETYWQSTTDGKIYFNNVSIQQIH